MNTEKVLKLGMASLILYYLRNYIAGGLIGCEYTWKGFLPEFLNIHCSILVALIFVISLFMWVSIICCIIMIFRKDKKMKGGKNGRKNRQENRTG
jgi:hypothetical protein